jgi:SAM-dependent methyltransferase
MATADSYSTEQFEENYPPGIKNHYWIKARNNIIYRHLKKRLGRSDVVLDIGCGTGVVLEFLNDKGIKCIGVERGIPKIENRWADKIYFGNSLENLNESYKTKITIGLILDVLEHIQQPEILINSITKNLRKISYLLVTVPARQELWSNYDDHFGHYKRYTTKELTELFRKNGYEVVEVKYFFHLLYFPLLILSKIGHMRKVKQKSQNNKLLHSIVASFFYLEEILIWKKLFGTSIILCAKPKNVMTTY